MCGQRSTGVWNGARVQRLEVPHKAIALSTYHVGDCWRSKCDGIKISNVKLFVVFIFVWRAIIRNIRKFALIQNFPLYGISERRAGPQITEDQIFPDKPSSQLTSCCVLILHCLCIVSALMTSQLQYSKQLLLQPSSQLLQQTKNFAAKVVQSQRANHSNSRKTSPFEMGFETGTDVKWRLYCCLSWDYFFASLKVMQPRTRKATG